MGGNGIRPTRILPIPPSVTVRNPVFPNQVQAGLPVGSSSTNTMQFYPQTPLVYQYNVEVQRQLTSSLSLRAAYIGAIGIHMTRVSARDLRIPTTSPNGTVTFATTSPFVSPTPGQSRWRPLTLITTTMLCRLFCRSGSLLACCFRHLTHTARRFLIPIKLVRDTLWPSLPTR